MLEPARVDSNMWWLLDERGTLSAVAIWKLLAVYVQFPLK